MKKITLILVSFLMIASVSTFTSCKKNPTTLPTINLMGSSSIYLSLNAGFNEPGVTATNSDGAYLNVKITSIPTFNKDLVGTYVFTYSAFDIYGNTNSVTRTVIVQNDAIRFEGTYSATDDGIIGSWHNTWTETIVASTTINNRVNFSSFGNYEHCQPFADFNTDHSKVNLFEQTFNCGTPTADHTFSGIGTVSSDKTITVPYTKVTGTTTNTGIAVFTKQI